MPDVPRIRAIVTRYSFHAKLEDHDVELISEHSESGLAPPHLMSELSAGREKFFAAIWEAMLYRHFRRLHLPLVAPSGAGRAGQNGPDLGIRLADGRTVWIEAVVATAGGSEPLQRFQAPEEGNAPYVPGKDMLLRVASALSSKTHGYKRRLQTGVVRENDAYFVAIHTGLLSAWPGDELGISRLPLVVEAVAAVGPLEGVIGHNSGKLSGLTPSFQGTLTNHNKSPVGMWQFAPGGSPLTGVIGANRRHMLDGKLYGSVVFNGCDGGRGFEMSRSGPEMWGSLDGFLVDHEVDAGIGVTTLW